jgi:hypothetical protein
MVLVEAAGAGGFRLDDPDGAAGDRLFAAADRSAEPADGTLIPSA